MILFYRCKFPLTFCRCQKSSLLEVALLHHKSVYCVLLIDVASLFLLAAEQAPDNVAKK